MALIRTGQNVIDIRGGCAGIYFTRDRSGLHMSRKPRTIRSQTAAQARQRNAFAAARAFSTDPRTVSYNIYRALNNLPMQEPPIEYQIPHLLPPP